MWALNAVDPWGSAWEVSGPGDAFDPGSGDLVVPEAVVADAIRSHRAVVLQESHQGPETVRYGAALVPGLRAAGATHLVFETYSQAPLDRFQRSGVFEPDTVVYGFDPARADLLRVARAEGLRLVAFDFPSGGAMRLLLGSLVRGFGRPDDAWLNRRREEYMAENVAGLLRRDPAARVVVWTGEQHAMRSMPAGFPWDHPPMAANLARLLGEAPFCVGQRLVDVESLAAGPCLVGPAHPWAVECGLDAVVLHHRGRAAAVPAWLERLRTPLPVEPEGAELVQAIPAAEGDGAVPADQRLTHGRPRTLLLRPGRYVLRGLAGDDSVRWSRTVDV
jgi:hypothetical protein